MTNPTNSAVHVDSALTNISVAFLQNANNFVAGRVFPNVPVSKQSDRYFVFDRGDFNRDEAEVRAPGTESAGAGYNLDNTPTYYANVWAIHHDVPDQVRANADAAVDPERAAAELTMHKMLIRREKEFVSKFMASGVWDTTITGVASGPSGAQTIKWSDTTSGDPIGDIDTAKSTILESTGFMPNKLVIGYKVFDALKRHPDIIDLVKYSGGVGPNNPALVSEQALAAVFGVEEVVVARAIENTAAEGATAAHSFIAGSKAMLVYAPAAPSLMAPSAGYQFSWTGFQGQGNAFGVATKRFYLDALESTRVEAQMAFDMKVISGSLGYLFDAII